MSHLLVKTEPKRTINECLQMSKNENFMTEQRDESARPTQNDASACSLQPLWDRDARELRVGDVVIKRFKWPAENQERVLDAFEDNGWPPRIENPLDQHPSICPKRRLHDTIKCLNRKQLNELIKFRGDGTGHGVLFEFNP